MQATRKFKILDNRFSTVESLGKQIYQRDQQIDFNEVDVNTVGKSKQSALVDFIIKRTMAKNIVMCVDIYDINYKQQVLQEIKRIRDNKRSCVHPFDINRRAFSPQPKIALMSFSKDAFFNKREGILKPCLKIKKLKIFTNQLKKIEKLLNKNKTKRMEMNICSIDKTSGNEVLMNSIKNYSNMDNCLPYSDNKADLNCTLYQDSQKAKFDTNKKKLMVADEMILSSPFDKDKREPRRTFQNFCNVITEEEIKEFGDHIWKDAHRRGFSL